MLNATSPHNGLKYHTIYLVAAGIFCISCLVLSGITPRLGFEAGVQQTPSGVGVIVKRVHAGEETVQTGDIIESVEGNPVQTRAALYYRLIAADKSVEMTVRRIGGRFQRPVDASDFDNGALPAGVHAGDKPVYIVDDDGTYKPINGVDFETLRSILDDHRESVSVVFKRPEEMLDLTVELRSPLIRTLSASLTLLLIVLMCMAAWQGRRRFHDHHLVWSNLILGLGTIGMMTLGLWTTLMSIPPLFMIGLIALTLFKAVDLDYHFVYFGRGRRMETWARFALYAGPIATLFIPLWFVLTEIPILWGGDIAAESELRLDSFIIIPMLWAAAYTIIDAGLALYRRVKNPHTPLRSYEIGIALASLLSIFVFVFLRIDMFSAQWFLITAFLVQSVSNVLPCLTAPEAQTHVRLDSPLFSTAPIREIFDRAHELLGNEWIIQIVIDRPAPRHIVSMTRSDEEDAFGGIGLNILTETWRDFLEVFRIEGGAITGASDERDPHNPVQGIADRLGIVIALPVADNVAGTLTSLTFLVSTAEAPKDDAPPAISLDKSKRENLARIIDEFVECAPAMVYQSAEISLDLIGEDIDEITRQYHETASFARALKNPTIPLDPRAIPHGLIDEDDVDDTDVPPALQDETVEAEPDDVSCETREYEEEVQFLRSQVAALYSQQIRGYALSEIEMTQAQQEALEDIAALAPPLLLIGEPGTGKRLLALADHQLRSTGAFLTIDAAAIPESIFALDMFGDGDDPGLIASAIGGSLLIHNADRISDSLMDDIINRLEKLPPKDNVALYLTVNTSPDDFSVEQYRLDAAVLPENLQKLAEQTDAEVIVIDPLRTQDDLDNVAAFFCQKQAISVGKPVEAFTSEALLALKSYAWPGNFTELKSVVERAVLRCETSKIAVTDLGRDFVDIADASTKNIAIDGTDVFREQVQLMQILNETQQGQIEQLNERIRQLENQLSEQNTEKMDDGDNFLDGTFSDIERRLLDRILDKYQRDPERAAEALATNHARFFNKLKKYKLIRFD